MPFTLQMFYQLPGITECKESDADIQRAILSGTADLIDENSCIADGLIIGTDRYGGMDAFNLKQVIDFKNTGYICEKDMI